jgi:hypothetical protein
MNRSSIRRVGSLLVATIRVFSVLVAAALVGLFLRSFFRADTLSWSWLDESRPHQRVSGITVYSYRGRIVMQWGVFYAADPNLFPLTPDEQIQLSGFGHFADDRKENFLFRSKNRLEAIGAYGRLEDFGDNNCRFKDVTIFASHLIIACFLFIPLWQLVLIQLVQLRRRRQGRCVSCGYDIRGARSRCPECGAACQAADPAGGSPATRV